MRRTGRLTTAVASGLCVLASLLVLAIAMPAAQAQDVDEIIRSLARDGYYVEPGADTTASEMQDVVRQTQGSPDTWYFVALADTVPETFSEQIFDQVSPSGNVIVYFYDGEFDNVQLTTPYGAAVDDRGLAPFDANWETPGELMRDIVAEVDVASASTGSGSGSSTTGSTDTGTTGSTSSGSSFPWLIVAIPALLLAGFWFMRRSGQKKEDAADLEAAQKIRAEIQTELDELANDVIVLGGPVDLSDKPDAVAHYREATDAYLIISDEVPDADKLEDADLKELSELGARVSHARWQMDAAEAIMDSEPIPEKPKVAPPPAPQRPAPTAQQRQRMPQRQPRPRVQYSQSRRRSGGGLLDILIAGAGMMGTGRRRGGMFGGSSRGRQSQPRSGGGMFGGSSRGRQSTPRQGGGVFGSGSGSRRSTSTTRSTSRRTSSTNRRSASRSQRSNTGRSSSRRRGRSTSTQRLSGSSSRRSSSGRSSSGRSSSRRRRR